MNIYDIIQKKRDGNPLNREEIYYFINGYVNNVIPDYQISALLMAIYLNKMSKDETYYLTKSMLDSGDTIRLSDIKGVKVDKHSTGGVGDKTTIILGPIIASLKIPFAKMSGRGLGHTGGTLDKLESIEGMTTEFSQKNFIDNVNNIGICIGGQTGNIVPADKKLYSLRDVTATVDNISLIAASIMSKKLAIKTDSILIDVKVGSGAFMKTLEEGIELAKEMIEIGNGFKREVICYLTDMDQPLGNMIGNELEIIESIDVLKGIGPKDITELVYKLGSELLVMGKVVNDLYEGEKLIKSSIETGKALEKFKEMVLLQGGNIKSIDSFPKAKYKLEIKAPSTGYIEKIDAETIGKASLSVGAGRDNLESAIDLQAGIEVSKKVGNYIKKGEIIGSIYSNNMEKAHIAEKIVLKAYNFSNNPIQPKKLILGRIDKTNEIIY